MGVLVRVRCAVALSVESILSNKDGFEPEVKYLSIRELRVYTNLGRCLLGC